MLYLSSSGIKLVSVKPHDAAFGNQATFFGVLHMAQSTILIDFLLLLDIDALQACKDSIWHKENRETIELIDLCIARREDSLREMASEPV